MCRNELGESSPKNTYMQQNGTYIKALYLRKDTTNFKSWQQKVDELRLEIMHEIFTEIPTRAERHVFLYQYGCTYLLYLLNRDVMEIIKHYCRTGCLNTHLAI